MESIDHSESWIDYSERSLLLILDSIIVTVHEINHPYSSIIILFTSQNVDISWV